MKLSNKQAKALGIVPPPKGKTLMEVFAEEERPKTRQKTTKVNSSVFDALCRAHGIPKPRRELLFHEGRKWRFDYAWIPCFVALEVQGGVWTQGRHTRGKGYLNDIDKSNEAQLAGWIVLQCTPAEIESGKACELVKRALTQRTS